MLADVTTQMPAYASEVFGPVAPVLRFDSLDEAVAAHEDGVSDARELQEHRAESGVEATHVDAGDHARG